MIYLLRPSFYLPDIPERSLALIALHEIGHELGLFGHSSTQGDLMYSLQAQTKGKLFQIRPTSISPQRSKHLEKGLPATCHSRRLYFHRTNGVAAKIR